MIIWKDETCTYPWVIGYLDLEHYKVVFKYKTIDEAVGMMNYLNGGKGYPWMFLGDNS